MGDVLTGQTVELLQTMIRNACVNDGSTGSGQEVRSVDALQSFLESTGVSMERFEPSPGRTSLVARIEGSDPSAASLCLMGHTDVVPVNPDGWRRDPFGAELIDGEVWGRGAVDMLNLTASMAVAFKDFAHRGFRPRGDLIFFAVADEESGSKHGAQWLADHEPDAIRADYVLTESGGLHSGPRAAPFIGMTVGEKGVAWRKLRVRGTPGHGSAPFRTNNALVKAAAIVQRLAAYEPRPRFHELWREQLDALGLPDEMKQMLMDPAHVDEALAQLPLGVARHLHACTHTTFSCNLIDGKMKTNVIPDLIDLGVDIRTMPGETAAEVQAHLDAALGELVADVEVELVMDDPASISRIDTPVWDALARAVAHPFPTALLTPRVVVGFTDARVYRAMGSVAYGAGLFNPDLDSGEYASRFHGNDERIDVESLRLTTQLWLDVVQDVLG